MLTRIIVIGVVLLVGVLIYVSVRAAMNRGSRAPGGASPQNTPPVDIVDRPTTSTSGTPKFESPDERIARLEAELRRLDDEDDGSGKGRS